MSLEPIIITSLSPEFWVLNIIEQVEYSIRKDGSNDDGGAVSVDFRGNATSGWTMVFSPVPGQSHGYVVTVILDSGAFTDEQASEFQAELFADWNQYRGDNPVVMRLKKDVADFPVIEFTRTV